MAKKAAAKSDATKPKAGASMQARAARSGKEFKPEAVVTAAAPKNNEGTKKARGPGRPKKEVAQGNYYSVSYFGGGKSAASPITRLIEAPDTSTAICAANKLNGLESGTENFRITATLINRDGEPLDTDYVPQTQLDAGQQAALDPEDAEDIEGEDDDDQDGDDE